ncbi:spermidine/putrescine ABC transporter permease [Marinobacter sp. Z-F4-2]|nr:spermidine/putrescine ABC transporter permease [Marinobacter sp. Z-F4-2]
MPSKSYPVTDSSAEHLPETKDPALKLRARKTLLWFKQPGALLSLPALFIFVAGFIGPLGLVVIYSFMPERSFAFNQLPTPENFVTIFQEGYYISYAWSVWLALVSTLILIVICWPVAYGLSRIFRRSMILTLLLVLPLFVSENVRLFGWVLTLLNHGILDGTTRTLFGWELPDMLYNAPVTVLGMVYVYLPFMLFPMSLGISMVPDACREAAFDMGATRWQVFKEVELPLAMPGIMIGCLLSFVLVLGSISEAKILGGQSIIMISHDIETAFTYAQNWPLGSALSTLLILLTAVLVIGLLSRLNLDNLLSRK